VRKPEAAKDADHRILELDPTPAGLITRSICKAYKSVWTRMRRELLRQHGAVCQVCGRVAEAARHIHCHEVYSFPNDKIVRLEQVVLLCWQCHDEVHFERTRHWCGQQYIDEIASHYRSVNGGLSERVFVQDVKRTFRRMLAIRKSYGGPAATPQLDYGPYKGLVDRYHMRQRWREMDWYERSDYDNDFKVFCDENDDGYYEMFPDHECPWDLAMLRG
jgi:hypothetical protein